MTPSAILIKSAFETAAQLQELTKLVQHSGLRFEILEDSPELAERLNKDTVAILFGAHINEPFKLARQLHSQVRSAQLIFLCNGDANEKEKRLKSQTAGVGKHWQTLVIGKPEWQTRLLSGINQALLRFRYSATVDNINQKLKQARSNDIKQLQSYTLSIGFLTKLVDNAKDAIVATTMTGIVVRWNKSAARMFDVTAEAAIGQPIATIISGEWEQELPTLMDNLLDEPDGHISSEIHCGRVGGRELYVDATLSVIHDETENLLGLSLIIRDITARKQTENELARLHQHLERLSFLDGLTGIANRRKFDLTLNQEWNHAVRSRQPLSIILIDIDHFKEFNDKYGHQLGDKCLKLVARTLSDVARRSIDLTARYGGEEFVLLLPEVDLEQAIALAEECREKVAAMEVPTESSAPPASVTISAGINSLMPNKDDTESEFVRLADLRLYHAKHLGRNRIVSETPKLSEP